MSRAEDFTIGELQHLYGSLYRASKDLFVHSPMQARLMDEFSEALAVAAAKADADPPPPPPEDDVLPLSEAQRRKLFAVFGDRGVTSRDERLELCSNVVGRRLWTMSDLTRAEAVKVIDHLEPST